jgi:hypothetical protein
MPIDIAVHIWLGSEDVEYMHGWGCSQSFPNSRVVSCVLDLITDDFCELASLMENVPIKCVDVFYLSLNESFYYSDGDCIEDLE